MEKLKIVNFKCFYNIEIPLKRLTIFAGANGNGKSTAIQALLFLRRTIEHCAKWENNRYDLKEPNELNVELNGAYCLALGNSGDIIPKFTNESKVVFGIIKDDRKFSIEYDTNHGDELYLTPIEILNNLVDTSGLFLQEFYYLNAERIGPRIAQGIKFFDFPNTGFQGEYVAQIISRNNYIFEIEEKRKNKKSKSPRLEQQVNAWLDDLMPGVSIYAVYNQDTHSAQIKCENYYTKGDPAVSPNVGFGISYVLPILVTGLIAKVGSYMIVENPEAHLHPSAQTQIGWFLAMVANAGVNVIVETHSDHILNGLQLAVANKSIQHDLVTINYFSYIAGENQPNVLPIMLSETGELSEWPNGFFDQTQIDFAELFNLRKG